MPSPSRHPTAVLLQATLIPAGLLLTLALAAPLRAGSVTDESIDRKSTRLNSSHRT